MTTHENLEAALGYVARGWAIVPLHAPLSVGDAPICSCGDLDCRSVGKHPITRHGLKDATTDPALVRAWWAEHPIANVGIVLGRASGMFAIDVDPRHGGDRELARLVRRHGSIGDTLHAYTGGAGDHYFFKLPDGRVRGKLGEGLDVKAEGGYVVAPPSLHASGGRYHWPFGDFAAPVLAAPAWLLGLLSGAASTSSSSSRPVDTRGGADVIARASAYLAKMAPAISGSGGHAATFAAAVALVRGFDLAADVALFLLSREYNPRCQPPWSRAELVHKVESAQRASLPRGYLLDADRRSAA